MKKLLFAATALLLLTLTAPALEVGDKAPSLELKTWYNGDPVDPGKPDGKTTYVVEFWATWCPPCRASIPHLKELQKKFKAQGVVLISITDESEEKVKPFMEKMEMDYRVALDTEQTTKSTYMRGIGGIPHAFVVDKKGVVVWSGHPMGGLDEIVAQVLKGGFSIETSKKTNELDTRLERYIRRNDMDGVIDTLAELIKVKPQDFKYHDLKIKVLTHQEKPDAVKEAYQDMLKQFGESGENLANLAEIAFTSSMEYRDPDIAWTAIRKAAELTENKDPKVLMMLAGTYYQLGFPAKALEQQKKALSLVADDAEEKPQMEAALKYYEKIVKMKESIQSKGE